MSEHDLDVDDLRTQNEALKRQLAARDALDNDVLAAEERISAIAADHAPPPPPAAPILAARDRVMSAPSRDVHPGSALYEQTVAALRASGVNFVDVDHDATFRPL